MRIGIVGAGAIGCYVGGKLAAAGADVVLVGRSRVRDELAQRFVVDDAPLAPPRFVTEIEELACDAVLCCVKCAQTTEVGQRLAGVLAPDATIASLQNGMHNDELLRDQLPGRRVLAGVVGFNVVSREPGIYRRTTSGALILEGDDGAPLILALRAAKLDVETRANLAPDRWTKLLVNLNNAVSALSDAPTRELLLSAAFRRIIAALVGEALDVLRAAKIKPAKLRGLPVGMMPAMLRLPTPILRLLVRAQLKVDPEARSSMADDLARGRATEVDQLNGEIVRLAALHDVAAPLNRRIVELVHDAERAGGSPRLSAEALAAALAAT